MHYHLEIIMPPTNDVESAVEQILKPFCEHSDEDDCHYGFWDFYDIGGRFSGEKLIQKIGRDKIKNFCEALKLEKITVSGLQFGKQEISPADQIPLVDQLWRKHFPDSTKVCPLFNHYKGTDLDVCTLAELPEGLTAARVIIAADGYGGELEAKYMIEENFFNGCSVISSDWDCKVQTAIDNFLENSQHWKPEYAEKTAPKADWLVVTIDYHS